MGRVVTHTRAGRNFAEFVQFAEILTSSNERNERDAVGASVPQFHSAHRVGATLKTRALEPSFSLLPTLPLKHAK